jgi:hypothetical protein
MPRVTVNYLYPLKARMGAQNGAYKHGGWSRNLTDEEREKVEADMKEYLKRYAYLNEPVALDLLREALILKDARIPRLQQYVLDQSIPMKDRMTAEKLLDSLQRTLALLYTRLGITYTSRTRRKEPRKVKTPLEMITEDK